MILVSPTEAFAPADTLSGGTWSISQTVTDTSIASCVSVTSLNGVGTPMLKGDIDSGLPGRFLFTWDCLAYVPDHKFLRYSTFLRAHAWTKACDCWVMFPVMQKWLWHIAWNTDFKSDVVTFGSSEGFVDALRVRVDHHQLPVRSVFQSTPDQLAKDLATMIDVKKVFFGNPSQQFTYGPRGAFVPRFGVGFRPLD